MEVTKTREMNRVGGGAAPGPSAFGPEGGTLPGGWHVGRGARQRDGRWEGAEAGLDVKCD